MTKSDIVNEVAKATGIEKIAVANVVEATVEAIRNSVENGTPVYIRNFGSFIIKQRAEKTARNITKGVTITVPAHKIPAFKPSKAFVIKKK